MGKKKTGGIAGCSESNNEVIKCSNNGNITGGEGTGGILGARSEIAAYLKNCYSISEVIGTDRTGNIVRMGRK